MTRPRDEYDRPLYRDDEIPPVGEGFAVWRGRITTYGAPCPSNSVPGVHRFGPECVGGWVPSGDWWLHCGTCRPFQGCDHPTARGLGRLGHSEDGGAGMSRIRLKDGALIDASAPGEQPGVLYVNDGLGGDSAVEIDDTARRRLIEALGGVPADAGWTLVRIGPCTHPRVQRRHLMVKECDCRTVHITEERDL